MDVLRTLKLLVAVFAAAPAWATSVRVAVPLGDRITGESPAAWRGADGRRTEGEEFVVRNLALPGRLRGSGDMRSGDRVFPLPVDVIAHAGTRYAVLELERERYLGGVVPAEMNPNWPTEALKAQAVIARTYVARRSAQNRRSGMPFDVIAGTVDQEFRWEPVVPAAVVATVRSTRGRILVDDTGGPAEVVYHSCCGGHTADASEVWGRSAPGLASVDDSFCGECPTYFWELLLSPAEIGGLFRLGPVTEISVLERGPSGRIVRVVVSDDVTRLELSGMEFRSKIGPERLKSTLVQVRVADSPDGPRWRFSGSGSGHGAGLCQFGAKVLAEQGRSYKEILSFYFPRLRLGEARE